MARALRLTGFTSGAAYRSENLSAMMADLLKDRLVRPCSLAAVMPMNLLGTTLDQLYGLPLYVKEDCRSLPAVERVVPTRTSREPGSYHPLHADP